MNREVWLDLANKVHNKVVNSRNFIDFEMYDELMHDVAVAIRKYGYFTYDGRFEDATIDYLCEALSEPNPSLNIDEYSYQISEIMKKHVTKNMILVPLNHLNIAFLPPCLYLSTDRNIALFSPTYSKKMFESKISRLDEFFSEYTHCKLNKQHILAVKDRCFFNYPILAIGIEHIDYRVEHEAPKIIEAAYSFLRMLDFSRDKEPGDNGWGVQRRDQRHEAYTYVVYYKDPNSDQNDINDGNLGYSFQFKFAPNLDINTLDFAKDPNSFTRLLIQVIDVVFMNPANTDEDDFRRYNRWVNAVLLFNTAYEFASIAKFDSALLLLVTILESLFLKSKDENQRHEGNKKARLSTRVAEFLKGDPSFASIDVKKVVAKIYDYRNDFIHEGIGLERFQSFRGLNDGEGQMFGQKPFIHGMWHPMPDEEFENYVALIKIVIFVLTRDLGSLPDTRNYPLEANQGF